MKKSLDLEPPSIREKQVNIKKGNINQLILLLKNEKHKSKIVDSGSGKNLETNIRLNSQDYVFDSDYLKTSSRFSEAVSVTTKSLSFTGNFDSNSNQIIQDNNYLKNKNDTYFIDKKKSTDFYEKRSSYSTISNIKEEEKKGDLSVQYKEQDNQEILYTLYLAEEDPIPENLKKF
jgi:hypothetical protein